MPLSIELNERQIPKPLNLSTADAAYMAGLIDGEGHIRLVKRIRRSPGSYDLRVHIASTSFELMSHLAGLYRANCFYGKPHKNTHPTEHRRPDTWKPLHNAIFQNTKAEALLIEVLPYLVIKKRQAQIGLECAKLKNRNGKRIDPIRAYKRIMLAKELASLTKRGINVSTSVSG